MLVLKNGMLLNVDGTWSAGDIAVENGKIRTRCKLTLVNGTVVHEE